jgi:hypothetical protein
MTNELADQVRSEVQRIKAVQDEFLQTYRQLCTQHGGPGWRGKDAETVFHQVRQEVIPIMEHAGMDDRAIQALCSWAERLVLHS